MDDIINTLTGNVNTNDNLVDRVLALIAELKRQQAEQEALRVQIGAATGDQITNLEGKIRELEANLAAYRAKLATANDTLESTITKMRKEIPVPALPGAEEKKADGKRRSRKRNSRKRKSRRSRKSKKRHY